MKFDLTKILISVATIIVIGFGSMISYIGTMILENQKDNADELILLTAKIEALKNDMDLDGLLDFMADKDSLTEKDYAMIEIVLTRGME